MGDQEDMAPPGAVAPSGGATPKSAATKAALPAPRLQLRWEVGEADERPWFADERFWNCHYELVLPLDKYDIRAEVWRDGEDTGERLSELVVPIKPPTRRGGSREPCTLDGGKVYADTPFRDGAHANWDAVLLGGLPIYVIALDGSGHLVTREAC